MLCFERSRLDFAVICYVLEGPDSILLLFGMKINDFRGLAGLLIHENSGEKCRKIWYGNCHLSFVDSGWIWDRFGERFWAILEARGHQKSGKNQTLSLERFWDASGVCFGRP